MSKGAQDIQGRSQSSGATNTVGRQGLSMEHTDPMGEESEQGRCEGGAGIGMSGLR